MPVETETNDQPADRYVNLEAQDRFVPADLLRSSYLHYDESLNRAARTFVSFESEDLELGIVSSQVPELARAVSSILSRSLEDAKYTHGGYLPPQAVERVQREVISPFGIASVWGVTGHRFVLSRPAGPGMREIIASILVGRSKDTIFFLTGRYNNLRHSTIAREVDLEQPLGSDPARRWFDMFAFPPLEVFKPRAYHQIANFVVIQELRRRGLGRLLIERIVRYYARDAILARGGRVEHSQFLLCGRGFWQVGDPPWRPRMEALGFYLRAGAESFFVEHDWAPLLPVLDERGERISNLDYNASHGLPQLYDTHVPAPRSQEHLLERVPEVRRLARDPRAKLQYFQMMYDFV